jgi:RNA recognition motif. (a.k.a. RRM, RBD, or RNP domain)
VEVDVVWQAGCDPYAFVEFDKHNDARLAMAAMNKRELLGRVCNIWFIIVLHVHFIFLAETDSY